MTLLLSTVPPPLTVASIKNTDRWDDEARAEAFGKAKIQAVNIMGVTVRTALREVYGDLDLWINNKIEEYVKRSKIS